MLIRGTSESALLTSLGIGAVVVGACVPTSAVGDGPVLCPFRRLTGLPCPGCGLTRSFVYTMHGDLPAAFAAHAFGPPLVAFSLVAAVTAVVRRRRGHGAVDLRRAVRHPLVVVAVIAWLGYAVARAAVGT
ncbi:DUF2752 domain-containing protein [Gordonia humi]|uniref:DUF2752 domain-containing protein n=1 Tax=Gordonia humi TaxID=686429 RepID=A0A840EWG8_9ACTN|nr:hypothetical protein [Gordonia humi]